MGAESCSVFVLLVVSLVVSLAADALTRDHHSAEYFGTILLPSPPTRFQPLWILHAFASV
jgi:hypothetical protein